MPKKKAKKKVAPRIKRRKNGQFAKKNGAGRPRGTKNKTPALLVQKILDIDGKLTLEKKGLLHCARKDPKWFYEKIMAKILPKNIELGTEGGPLKVEIIDSYKVPKNAHPA